MDIDWISHNTSTYSRPLIAGGFVLTMHDGAVVALNPATGAESWRRFAGQFARTMTMSGSTIYVSAGPLGVTALSLSSGAVLWTTKACGDFDGNESAQHAAVSDGILAVAMNDRISRFQRQRRDVPVDFGEHHQPRLLHGQPHRGDGSVITDTNGWMERAADPSGPRDGRPGRAVVPPSA